MEVNVDYALPPHVLLMLKYYKKYHMYGHPFLSELDTLWS